MYGGTKNGRKCLYKSAIYWVVFLDTNWKINTPLKTQLIAQIIFPPNQFPHPSFSLPFSPHPPNRPLPSHFQPYFRLHFYPYNFTYSTNSSQSYINFSYPETITLKQPIIFQGILMPTTNLANKSLSTAITGGMFKLYWYDLYSYLQSNIYIKNGSWAALLHKKQSPLEKGRRWAKRNVALRVW